MKFRTGIGYDIHELIDERKLFLGGVEIPYYKGLKGHSDADVLLHAICDAILGALGKGDIGEHFPDTDEKYKDISSIKLLGYVNNFMKENGYLIGNIDSVVQAEEPNLSQYKGQIKEKIAFELGIAESCVGIKATTFEGLGPIGQKKAIAAFATVLLTKQEG
ncbi:MAG: 2-C-methyl-D-erythritol 2,4-cyclodiphosphate synthase [Candidatus Zapsychrus exili]|nr:2-C-methyl-D-erythritol 2,4-cyclodiphosphate synthase [Candidatus Zapsychrus exili]